APLSQRTSAGRRRGSASSPTSGVWAAPARGSPAPTLPHCKTPAQALPPARRAPPPRPEPAARLSLRRPQARDRAVAVAAGSLGDLARARDLLAQTLE